MCVWCMCGTCMWICVCGVCGGWWWVVHSVRRVYVCVYLCLGPFEVFMEPWISCILFLFMPSLGFYLGLFCPWPHSLVEGVSSFCGQEQDCPGRTAPRGWSPCRAVRSKPVLTQRGVCSSHWVHRPWVPAHKACGVALTGQQGSAQATSTAQGWGQRCVPL